MAYVAVERAPSLSRRDSDRGADMQDLWLILLGTAMVSIMALAVGINSPDSALFASAGLQLFSPQALDVFADPKLQVGPLYLLLVGAGAGLGSLAQLDPQAAGTATAAVAAVVGLNAVARASAALPAVSARAGILLQVVLGGGLAVALLDGHVEDILVMILLAGCGVAISSGRAGVTGLMLGAACATKLWAVVGVIVLMLLPSARQRLSAVATTGAIVLLTYAPFLLHGNVRTAEYRWTVAEPSVAGIFLEWGLPVTWQFRALQAVLACLVVALVLVRTSVGPHLVWLVPGVVLMARLATEPNILAYYWAAAVVPAAFAVWSIWRDPLRAAAAGAACSVLMLLVISCSGRVGSLVTAALLASGLAALRSRRFRSTWTQSPSSLAPDAA